MRVVLFSILALWASTSLAQMAIPGEVTISSDADDFDALRVRSGALLKYASPFDYAGVAVQATRYRHSGWDLNAPGVLFVWRKQRRETLEGSIAEAGIVKVGGRTRVVGDATWSFRPSPHTGFELIAVADLVETRPALDRGVAYTFAGASAERQLTKRLTAIGLGGYQRFTDGNDRLHFRGRLIWMLVPEHGISAQVRYRRFDTGDLEVERTYFNPEHYSEWQAALAIRKRHAGWLWAGTLGAGQEDVDRATHPTMLAEIRTEGTLARDIRIVLRASYNRSAGFADTNEDWYRVAGISVIFPF